MRPRKRRLARVGGRHKETGSDPLLGINAFSSRSAGRSKLQVSLLLEKRIVVCVLTRHTTLCLKEDFRSTSLPFIPCCAPQHASLSLRLIGRCILRPCEIRLPHRFGVRVPDGVYSEKVGEWQSWGMAKLGNGKVGEWHCSDQGFAWSSECVGMKDEAGVYLHEETISTSTGR
jgi:hypothetical protein